MTGRCIGYAPMQFLIVSLFVFAGFTSAQETATYESRPIATNARSLGLGDAMVADIFDVSTMAVNPASLAYLQHRSVMLDHSEEKTIHVKNENFSIPFSLGVRQTLALSLNVRHVGYIGETNSQIKVIEYGYDVAFASEVAHEFSVGGTFDVRYGTSENSKTWAVSGSLGIIYVPSASFSYGAVYHGIGHGITYATDPSGTVLGLSDLPGSIEAGLTLRYPTLFRPISLTLSLSNEKIFEQFGILYRAGMELIFKRVVVARIGYDYDSGPRIGSVSYGLGIRTDWINFDYAVAPQKWSDETYRFSLALPLR